MPHKGVGHLPKTKLRVFCVTLSQKADFLIFCGEEKSVTYQDFQVGYSKLVLFIVIIERLCKVCKAAYE